jgi:FkbM family methyltransferase
MRSRILALIIDWLLHLPRFRYQLDAAVRLAQLKLGVGSGGHSDESGEDMVFRLLRRREGSTHPPCVFDVGANEGQYLASALAALPDGAIVHSFEPSSAAFARLREAMGSQPRAVLNHCGLADQAGTRQLHTDCDGSTLASLTQRDLGHVGLSHDRSELVRIETLDGYCDAHAVERIDLLKIDVEGHELDVLKGSRRMLEAGRIGMIAFEFGGANIDTRTYVRDFWYFLQQAGMRSLHRIMPGRRLYRIDRYDESLEAFRTSNFLAVFDPAVDPAAAE